MGALDLLIETRSSRLDSLPIEAPSRGSLVSAATARPFSHGLAVASVTEHPFRNDRTFNCDQLHISRHTVDFYLRHIFQMLHISSRVELARIVGDARPPSPPSPDQTYAITWGTGERAAASCIAQQLPPAQPIR